MSEIDRLLALGKVTIFDDKWKEKLEEYNKLKLKCERSLKLQGLLEERNKVYYSSHEKTNSILDLQFSSLLQSLLDESQTTKKE